MRAAAMIEYGEAMDAMPMSVILVIAVATVFLSVAVGLTYGVRSKFVRTRFIMTGFFIYIVFTLTASFWQFALATLPYTIPAALLGVAIGYFVGVRAASEKLKMQGVQYYMEHFAHVHIHEVKALNWWSLINYYSVMGVLVLINLVGLSNVIFDGSRLWAIITSTVGALLIGSIVPYLIHLWSIRATGMH